MEIREANEGDVAAIVTLLKQSLGESLMPKSETYWRWKHIDNPFGASPVLLAWDSDKLVGVRAFMRWRWRRGAECFEAVRAVDTATHPDYQGKGIFSKLTKASLETCKSRGWHFVFNTPNEKSKPGYLKMGWVEAGKLPLHAGIVRPVSIALNMLTKGKQPLEVVDTSVNHYLSHPGFATLVNETISKRHGLITDHSIKSLKWRYSDVPVARYGAVAADETELGAVLFYRIKQSRAGTEFRIVDFFSASAHFNQLLSKKVMETIRRVGADYVTASASSPAAIVAKGLLLKNLRVGPVVTVRELALTDLSALTGFKNWEPSLGDLELF